MYNLYCNKLKIDVPPLIQDVDTLDVKGTYLTQLSFDLINPKMMDLLTNLGLTVRWLEIFYRKPGDNCPLHTDDLPGDYAKLNFIYGGAESVMNWFEPNKEVDAQVQFTDINSRYVSWNYNDVDKVHSEHLQGSYLIQVGRPHNVQNVIHERYCLCFLLKKENKRLSMLEAYNLFHEWRT